LAGSISVEHDVLPAFFCWNNKKPMIYFGHVADPWLRCEFLNIKESYPYFKVKSAK
jgi:hypothetical protein